LKYFIPHGIRFTTEDRRSKVLCSRDVGGVTRLHNRDPNCATPEILTRSAG